MADLLSKREFDLMMQHSKNGIIVFRAVGDDEFSCYNANPTFQTLMHLEGDDDLLGKRLDEVFTENLASIHKMLAVLRHQPGLQDVYATMDDVLYKVHGASIHEAQEGKSIILSFNERWRYSPSFYGNQALMDAMQDAIFIFDYVRDGEFRLTFLNEEHQRSTGMSLEHDAGKTPQELVGEEEGARIAANYQRCIDENTTMQYEEYVVLPAGTKWWQTKIAPVLIDGKPRQIIGAGREITALKNANEALNALYIEYEAIFNESSIPMWVHEVDEEKQEFRVRRYNRCYEETFQMKTEDFRGKTIHEVLEEPYASEVQAIYLDIVRDPKPFSFQQEIKLNNRYYTNLTTLAPVIRNGKVINIVGSSKDISEIKRYQDVLELEGEMLAQRLARRTTALQASAGQQEEFFESVTQEFRAPITSILGLIEVAKQTVTEHEPLYPYLQGMQEETEQLMGFVDAILDATQADKESDELRIRRFDIKQAIQKVIEMVSTDMPQFEGRIQFEDLLPMTFIWQDEDNFMKVFPVIIKQALVDTPGGESFTFKGEYLEKTRELCFSCLTDMFPEKSIHDKHATYTAGIDRSPQQWSHMDIALTQLRAKQMGGRFASSREGTQNKAEFYVPLLGQ